MIITFGFRLLKLACILLFLVFFINMLSNIFFFMGFQFESYCIYLVIITVLLMFIAVLPDRKYTYGIFFK